MSIPGDRVAPMAGAAASGGGSSSNFDIINQSLRFNGAIDEPDLVFEFGTPTDANKFIIGTWFKKTDLGRECNLFGTSGSTAETLIFQTDDTIRLGYSGQSVRETTRVFRDTTSWMHIVIYVDTSQATASDRIKMFINGVQETAFDVSNNPTLNEDPLYWNIVSGTDGIIGGQNASSLYHFDGYMAQFFNIDGVGDTSTYPITTFGEFDDNGVWIPKSDSDIDSAVTWGNNGFLLNFSNTANFGEDYTSNGNDLTPNSFNADDQYQDSPTKTYCTWNNLSQASMTSNVTFQEGNIRCKPTDGSNRRWNIGTIGMTSGKWYWEVVATDVTSASNYSIGIASSTSLAAGGGQSDTWTYLASGNFLDESSSGAYGASYTDADIIGVAFDADNGTLTFYKNGSSQGTAKTGLTSGPYFPCFATYQSGYCDLVTDENKWTYSAPANHNPLSTEYMPEVSITSPDSYFNCVGYTGDGTAIGSGGKSITGVGFQPDMVWIKNRDASDNHLLFNSGRGTEDFLYPDTATAEASSSESLTAYDSDGFTVGNHVAVNTNSEDYIAWCWKNDAVAGFDEVIFTGNSTAGTTHNHDLGVTPEFIILKNVPDTPAGGQGWLTYHTSEGATKYGLLDSSNAWFTSSIAWNDTAPTSDHFSIGGHNDSNANGDEMQALVFAGIEGFSKMADYIGNGSADGPFIYLGFRPKYVLIKNVDAGQEWYIRDSVRDTYNPVNTALRADAVNGEVTGAAYHVDFLSNGFKIKSSNATVNASGQQFIYVAFAEFPFGGSNVLAARAR